MTGLPASGSTTKGNLAANIRDHMNESALATIEKSVRPVHLRLVTAVGTAKDTWDALKDILEV